MELLSPRTVSWWSGRAVAKSHVLRCYERLGGAQGGQQAHGRECSQNSASAFNPSIPVTSCGVAFLSPSLSLQ